MESFESALTGGHLFIIFPYLFLGFSNTLVPAPALCSGLDVSSPLLVFPAHISTEITIPLLSAFIFLD